MTNVDQEALYHKNDQYPSIKKSLNAFQKAGWLTTDQTEEDYSQCLIALIKMLGVQISDKALCSTFPSKHQEISLVSLLNTLARVGYVGSPLKGKLKDIDERLFPCLFIPAHSNALYTKNVPVVIAQKKRSLVDADADDPIYTIFDQEAKDVTKLDEVSGTFYVFNQEENSDSSLSSHMRAASGYSWFRALLERFKPLFWQVLMLSVMINVISLSLPILVMFIYDQVITSYTPETLAPLLFGASLAIISEWLLRSIRTNSLTWFSTRLNNIVSTKIFEQLMLIPPIFTERASVSSQISRLKAFESVRDFFSSSLFASLIELPFTLIAVIALAFLSPTIAFVSICAIIAYLLLFAVTQNRVKTLIKLSARESSELQQITIETFEKLHLLKTNGLTEGWLQKIRGISGKSCLSLFNVNKATAVTENIAHGLFMLSGLAVIVIGVHEIWQGAMSTGALIACTILIWRVLGPFQILCTASPRFERIRNSIIQVNKLMEITPERLSKQSKSHISDLQGKVQFSSVGLRYTKTMDPVFSGLSFNAEPGQLVTITGNNGSGKSTILKLINGLYLPQAGNIRLDGLDIRQLDAIELRQKIAYVSQSPHFFPGSILENLRYVAPLATEDAIKKILIKLNAWEDIEKLPQQLETNLGENKIGIPTLLTYKLNLARAYLQDSSVMLIDELPYALLNSSTGEAFLQELSIWKGKKTIILVTHREDYIDLADTAIFLQSGQAPIVARPATVIEKMHRANL